MMVTSSVSHAVRSLPRSLRVCYVQAYRAPEYVRGRSLCNALERAESIELSRAVNVSSDWRRYWQALRGLVTIRHSVDPDVYVLGFRGHEIVWLVRWITHGKPLVLDALMSPSAALSEESKHGLAGLIAAPLIRVLEHVSLKAADLVLTDTQSHVDYYVSAFGMPRSRFLAVPVGALEVPVPTGDAAAPPNRNLRVLFYGSFLPLHGMETMLEAATLTADLPIEFEFVGGTPAQGGLLAQRCSAAGIRHQWRAWIPFESLVSSEIPRADVCLGGPFGATPQAKRVVTGKTSQCMALGKATVVGRIAEDFGFIDRENCLLVDQGDPRGLADALRWCHAHRDRLPAIGEAGRRLYLQRLSIDTLSSLLVPALHDLAAARGTSGK